MRVQDSTGGTIKSGGKTRRAAVMQTLSDWHPDVVEFIEAKQKEEKKAHALIDAGFDGSFNGDAYGSVDFQNVNQSVRFSDRFMYAAQSGTSEGAAWPLTSPATGKTVEMVDARELMRKIAEGTWFCGDPGVQYDDTIQNWHTCPSTDRIRSSNQNRDMRNSNKGTTGELVLSQLRQLFP